MYILGLNAFHGDSAACLLRDGRFYRLAVVRGGELRAVENRKIRGGFPRRAN